MYLKDYYGERSEMSIDDAVIMLSWEKFHAFTDRELQSHMTEKDYLGIHKASSLKGDLLSDEDFAMDKEFDSKQLLEDVRNDLPFDREELGMEDLTEDDFESDM